MADSQTSSWCCPGNHWAGGWALSGGSSACSPPSDDSHQKRGLTHIQICLQLNM